jgi:hypothetical protein
MAGNTVAPSSCARRASPRATMPVITNSASPGSLGFRRIHYRTAKPYIPGSLRLSYGLGVQIAGTRLVPGLRVA